jgi:hypothetical protein
VVAVPLSVGGKTCPILDITVPEGVIDRYFDVELPGIATSSTGQIKTWEELQEENEDSD